MSRLPSTRSLAFLGTLLYLAIALGWFFSNLTHVPGYGDTGEYVKLSETLRVDELRGILYPALLALVSAWFGEIDFQPPAYSILTIQLFQYLISAAALSYVMHVCIVPRLVVEELPRGRRRTFFGLLFLLLLFDPFVSHFSLAVMTDSLALSAALAWCAALADLLTRRSPPALAWGVLVVSLVTMTGVRVERTTVIVFICLVMAVSWRWLARRRVESGFLSLPRPLLAALLVSIALCGVAQASRSLWYEDLGRWPALETMVHFRYINPGLTEIYDSLPADIQGRISREDAALYDQRVHNSWTVIDEVTDGDDADRRELTLRLLAVSLKERWLSISGRVAGTFFESLFATPSFYARVGDWKWSGEGDARLFVTFEGQAWVYRCMSPYMPRLTAVFTGANAVLLTVFSGLALALVRRKPRVRRDFPEERTGPAWLDAMRMPDDVLPFVYFWVCSSLVLAASTFGVFLRYSVFSHVMLLLVVLPMALGWMLDSQSAEET